MPRRNIEPAVAPRKKKAASSAPAITLPQQLDVTVHGDTLLEWIKKRTVYFVFIVAVGGAVTVLWNGWSWLGLPRVVADRELHDTLEKVTKDVQTKISTTAGEINVRVDKLGDQLIVVNKKQDQANVVQLEQGARQLFLQKQQLVASLSNIELQLRERPADAFLITRKGELESFVRSVDRETDAVQDQLRRARTGN